MRKKLFHVKHIAAWQVKNNACRAFLYAAMRVILMGEKRILLHFYRTFSVCKEKLRTTR